MMVIKAKGAHVGTLMLPMLAPLCYLHIDVIKRCCCHI